MVFGPRNFPVNDVLALVLHDVPKISLGYEVQLSNGNQYHPRQVKLANGKVMLEDEVLGEVTFPLSELKRFSRAGK